MAGRPSDYTPELAEVICSMLAEGQSLRKVCSGDDMPSMPTVFSWFRKHPEFLNQYARAKEESADALVEEMMDIADNDTEDVQRSRLKVDTRKWVASKLKAKKYGDKVTQEHTGSDGGPVKVFASVGLVAVDATADRTTSKDS